MKLGKEELQKLFLGGLLLMGVVYSYFDMLLFPLKKKQAAATKSAIALGPEIQTAQAQINKTHELEVSLPEKTIVLRQADELIPEGSPVAWVPTKVGEFFKRFGVEKVTTKLNGEFLDKDLPGFRRLAWGIDVPKISFGVFGGAVCALENEEPLLEIRTLQIDATREEVQSQHVAITMQNLVKQ